MTRATAMAEGKLDVWSRAKATTCPSCRAQPDEYCRKGSTLHYNNNFVHDSRWRMAETTMAILERRRQA